MTCIITGCAAFNGHEYVGGDLHQIGDCFVFNAIFVIRTGDAAWSAETPHYTKHVDFSRANSYWERRGTLVAPAHQCELNDAAREYLGMSEGNTL